jgi:hypothetical protein
LKATVEAKTAIAVRKPTGGAIVSIQEALKAQVAGMSERTQPAGGNKIKLSPGKFSLPDGTEAQGELQLVVVDFVTVHKFYEGKYDSKNIVPPGCFAIGVNPKQMTPSANSPNLQSESCQGCPMNEFGSSGEGKACKNGRLLAVLPPDADDKTDMWLLEVSPTALKNFDGYVNSVARQFQMPPVGVITTVSLDPNVDYPKLVFSDPQPNNNLELSFARQGEAREMLNVEPDVSGWQAPNTKGRAAAKPVRR